MPLADDLYKSLVDESKLYREKVQTIWLQKFTMLGAIIAFAALRSEASAKNPTLIAAAFLALPAIAVLLDIKLAEFGIHANLIDHFIIRNYAEPPVVGDWERSKWGLCVKGEDGRLVRLRSIATVAVTVIPTSMIAALAVLAVEPFVPSATHARLRVAALVFCPAYVVLGWIVMKMVLFRSASLRPNSKGEGAGPTSGAESRVDATANSSVTRSV